MWPVTVLRKITLTFLCEREIKMGNSAVPDQHKLHLKWRALQIVMALYPTLDIQAMAEYASLRRLPGMSWKCLLIYNMLPQLSIFYEIKWKYNLMSV